MSAPATRGGESILDADRSPPGGGAAAMGESVAPVDRGAVWITARAQTVTERETSNQGGPFRDGQSSRGRTRPLRLRALDAYLVARERQLLRREDADWKATPIIDVGLGDAPGSTLELARTLRAVNPELEVWGVDHAPARVEAASPFADARTHFVVGDFDTLPTLVRPARLIRVMNVLRGFPVDAALHAHRRIGEALHDGGLALEGSSDPEGAVLTAHLLRREGAALIRSALLFHTDGARGFAPWMFRDWLPRDLRRSVRPGSGLHAFLSRWTGAFEASRGAKAADAFARAAHALAAMDPSVPDDAELFAGGTLVWSPAGGVPRD